MQRLVEDTDDVHPGVVEADHYDDIEGVTLSAAPFLPTPEQWEVDLAFSRRLRALKTFPITRQHLEIKESTWESSAVNRAQLHLSKLGDRDSGPDKLLCIQEAFDMIVGMVRGTRSSVAGADDSVPCVIMMVIGADPTNLVSTIDYILSTLSQDELASVEGLVMNTLEGVVNFIQDCQPDQFHSLDPEFHAQLSSHISKCCGDKGGLLKPGSAEVLAMQVAVYRQSAFAFQSRCKRQEGLMHDMFAREQAAVSAAAVSGTARARTRSSVAKDLQKVMSESTKTKQRMSELALQVDEKEEQNTQHQLTIQVLNEVLLARDESLQKVDEERRTLQRKLVLSRCQLAWVKMACRNFIIGEGTPDASGFDEQPQVGTTMLDRYAPGAMDGQPNRLAVGQASLAVEDPSLPPAPPPAKTLLEEAGSGDTLMPHRKSSIANQPVPNLIDRPQISGTMVTGRQIQLNGVSPRCTVQWLMRDCNSSTPEKYVPILPSGGGKKGKHQLVLTIDQADMEIAALVEIPPNCGRITDYPLEDDTVRLGGHQVIVTYSVRVRQDTATIDICNQIERSGAPLHEFAVSAKGQPDHNPPPPVVTTLLGLKAMPTRLQIALSGFKIKLKAGSNGTVKKQTLVALTDVRVGFDTPTHFCLVFKAGDEWHLFAETCAERDIIVTAMRSWHKAATSKKGMFSFMK